MGLTTTMLSLYVVWTICLCLYLLIIGLLVPSRGPNTGILAGLFGIVGGVVLLASLGVITFAWLALTGHYVWMSLVGILFIIPWFLFLWLFVLPPNKVRPTASKDKS